jgi:hypothetical protein
MAKSPHTGGERGIVPDWRAIGITRRLEGHDRMMRQVSSPVRRGAGRKGRKDLARSLPSFKVLAVPFLVYGAQLQVRGLGQAEQNLKASVDPGEPEVQEMGETVLTPPHPDPFEALLDEPFAGTLYHSRAQR